jgi:nitroreductase
MSIIYGRASTNLPNTSDMKTKLSFIAIVFFALTNLQGQAADNCVTKVILSSYSERAYTSEPVADAQLDVILECGMKAPSARNLQPWRFTVIKDEATMKEIVADVVPGNALVVVSGMVSEDGGTPDFDCGLAAENMFLAAHGLGLGARMYGSPAAKINENRDLFQIPAGYNAVIVLRIGNVDEGVDAVSAATQRKSRQEVINYRQ